MTGAALIYGAEYWAKTDGFTTGVLAPTAQRGRVQSVFYVNSGTDTFYIQVFDKASAPGAGDVCKVPPIPIYGGMYGGINFPDGLRMTNGIYVRISTQCSYAGDATALAASTAGGLVGWSGIP